MNNTVYVDFLFKLLDSYEVPGFIRELGDDFELIYSSPGYVLTGETYWKISGKINAETATMLKLSDTIAADIRISYTDTTLKDNYRS